MNDTAEIVDDESGTLVSGCFYQFGIQFSDDVDDEPDLDDSWIVAERSPTDEELRRAHAGGWMWAEVVPEDWADVETRRDCPIDPTHVTHSVLRSLAADLMGLSRVGDILPDSSTLAVVVSAGFAAKVRDSGLKGFGLAPLPIKVKQAADDDPSLCVLRFLGRDCERARKVVGVPNACPFCGHHPLICPICGYWPLMTCPACGQEAWIGSKFHGGVSDRRLKVHAMPPKAGPILAGHCWDGADFIGSNPWYLTKRAIDWLLSVHAAPFYARPARVCTDGMTDEQKSWLERARRPIGG